jgi:hypothetical protein
MNNKSLQKKIFTVFFYWVRLLRPEEKQPGASCMILSSIAEDDTPKICNHFQISQELRN